MSEQQQGPGWWMASDGRWYPPEQRPAPAAPSTWAGRAEPGPVGERSWAVPEQAALGGVAQWSTPPPAPVPPVQRMSTGRKVALVLGSVVGVLVLLVAVVMLLGTSSEKSDAVAIRRDVPGSFQHFEDPDHEFALDLHPEWYPLSVRGDVTGIGARTVPDDPNAAAALDQMVATLPRQIVFAAVDPGPLGTNRFVPNVNLLAGPRGGATLDEMEAALPATIEQFGAQGVHVERVETSYGDGFRMSYRFAPGGPLSGVRGLQYYVVTDDQVWVFTLTSDDMPRDRTHFEQSVASFTLTP